MKTTFLLRMSFSRTFACAALAGPARLAPYRAEIGEVFQTGAAQRPGQGDQPLAGEHYHTGATAGTCNDLGN